MIPLVALLVGAVLGLVLQPTVPVALARYLAVGIVAALDAVFGAVRARLDGSFSDRTFLVSFLSNVVVAAFLVYLGDQIGVGSDLSLAVVVALGVRMFANLSEIRRHLFGA